jgi:hypothetical protein
VGNKGFFPETKAAWSDSDHIPPSNAAVEWVDLYLTFPIHLYGVVFKYFIFAHLLIKYMLPNDCSLFKHKAVGFV